MNSWTPCVLTLAAFTVIWAQTSTELDQILDQIRAGIQLRQEARFSDAERVLLSAHARAYALNPASPAAASSANQLGMIYQELGRVPDAEHYYQIALRITELQGDPVRVLTIVNNLGSLYVDNALFARVERLDLWKRAQQVGSGLQVARAKATLGSLAMAQGRFDQAESLFNSALPVFEAERRWADVLIVRCNLGLIAARSGRLSAGIAKLEECISLLESSGPQPIYPRILSNVAVLYAQAGRRSDAARTAEHAASLSVSLLGASSPVTAAIFRDCATAMKGAGNKPEAKRLLRAANEIARASHTDMVVDVSDLLPRSKPGK